jgi:pimeloyl-ACP methyl ester carboxylesterase
MPLNDNSPRKEGLAHINADLQLVNGHHLYVERCGLESSPPVVLLHHGLGSVYSWKDHIVPLGEAGFHVIAYDRWGYGRSDSRQTLSMPFFEEDLQDLETLTIDLSLGPAALVGHSDGGTIALYFSESHSESVACLVTAGAHIYVEPKMNVGIESVHSKYERNARFRRALRRLHGDKTEAVFQGWYQGWTKPENLNWDMREGLSKIRCPTLVIQGKEDEHATRKHVEDIAAGIPQAQLWLVTGATHMLPQEIPEIFNRRVIEFLRSEFHIVGS